jgi:hypothetical protein
MFAGVEAREGRHVHELAEHRIGNVRMARRIAVVAQHRFEQMGSLAHLDEGAEFAIAHHGARMKKGFGPELRHAESPKPARVPPADDIQMKGHVIRPSSNRINPPTMDMLAYACLAFSAIALACQAGSCALAALRCRKRRHLLWR